MVVIELLKYIVISIHAPREGSDGLHAPTHSKKHISIHAPREGSDCGEEKGEI